MLSGTLSKQALSSQLADQLKSFIETGQWPQGSKVPAIRDIAQQFDVSVNTAMYALRELEGQGLVQRQPHGSAFVRQGGESSARGAADRVAAAARELRRIGIVGTAPACFEPVSQHDDWASGVTIAAERRLLAAGQFVVSRIGSRNPDVDQLCAELAEQVRAMRDELSGIMISSGSHPAYMRLIETCQELELPWVTIKTPTRHLNHNYVAADNFDNGVIAGRAFVAMDYRHVMLLTPELQHAISYRDQLLGLTESYLLARRATGQLRVQLAAGISEEAGYQAAREYLKCFGPPEAIYSTGDVLLAGGMRACREAGLRMPQDVALLGSTGLELGKCTTPRLAVVPQPMEAIGATAIELLLEMVDSGRMRVFPRRIPSRLILRESLPLTSRAITEVKQAGIEVVDALSSSGHL